MSSSKNSSDESQGLKTETTTQKSQVEKTSDSNSETRTIVRGKQVHPKYQRTKIKTPATIPKKDS